MKLIIDIPDNQYNQICELRLHNRTIYDDAIRNGIPLDEPFINKPCISEGVCHEDKVKVLDKIRAEIESYEADCILADDSKECKECDKIVFGSIYRIIDKYTKGESEIWNTPNADNRIVAPKGTFKKIYEDEDDDNDI